MRRDNLFGLAAAGRRLLFATARPTAVQPVTAYIAAGAGAAFFERRVFRRAVFFAPLRRVFLAAPRAPALRTVRFLAFPFAFRFDFFALIGM